MTRTYEGVVLHWSQKGFGFLFNDEIGRRIFFHVKDWNRAAEPVAREVVTFELQPSRTAGKPDVAVNVTPKLQITDAGVNALAKAGAR
jgi:cold shock CspA family protein